MKFLQNVLLKKNSKHHCHFRRHIFFLKQLLSSQKEFLILIERMLCLRCYFQYLELPSNLGI